MAILRKLHTTRPPSVLFVSRAYPPSGGERAVALRDMAVNFVQRGWRVTVLTGSCDASDAFLSAGVRIVRVGAPLTGSLLLRLFASLFIYPALIVRALLLGRFDVVVTKSEPPILLVIGSILGLFLRARTVHWVDVLYPEVYRLWRPFAAVAEGLSSLLLRLQDRLVVTGRCMEERLRGRGVPPDRIDVIPSWPNQTLRPVEHRFNAFRPEHDLQGKFVVMYSGTIRRTHELDSLLHAAGEIKGAYPDIRFVIVRDGPGRARVAARIEEDALDNVRLLSLPSENTGGTPERMSNRLSAGDLHVVTMEEDACGLDVPGTLYAAMAVRRPCLFFGPERSEAALFIHEHGAGEAIADAEGLALRILGWYQSDVRRRIAGDRAYRAVRLLRANALIDFEDMLRGLLGAPATDLLELPPAHPTAPPNALAA